MATGSSSSQAGAHATAALPRKISLVVSDVDGTLVTHDKELLASSVAAAHKLREAGIRLAAVSSRPPRGMALLVEGLDLQMYGGFNGGLILDRERGPVDENDVPAEAARIAIDAFRRAGVDIWVFAGNDWFITNPDGHYVPRERRTVQFEPTVVTSFEPHLQHIGKVVGSSTDFDLLARIETELSQTLGTLASARRSQQYYLDITHPTADKGHAVRAFARAWDVPMTEVAVIGDMANDLPMFAVAALAIAMGNAPPEVQARAHAVTTSNDDGGWAKAIEDFVLPRA